MSVGSAQYLTEISKGKGKAVPLQARIGPEGSRNLSFSDFMTKAQDGDKVVSLTHRPPLPPGNAPGTHFCSVLSRPQGHSAIGRIFMSMKNSNDIRWDRTTVLPICSTAREPLCYRGPLTEMSTRRISWGSKAERPPRRTDLSTFVCDCLECWEPQLSGTLMVCPVLYRNCSILYLNPWTRRRTQGMCTEFDGNICWKGITCNIVHMEGWYWDGSRLWELEMDIAGSGSCLIAGFYIRSVEWSSYIRRQVSEARNMYPIHIIIIIIII